MCMYPKYMICNSYEMTYMSIADRIILIYCLSVLLEITHKFVNALKCIIELCFIFLVAIFCDLNIDERVPV